jgi:adenylate kinase family enzyme
MQRIVVVGDSGSGKSTLAEELSRRLNLPYTELDGLYWGPNWAEADIADFRRQVAALTERDRWVLDGNYTRARDLLWGRADTLIWLDYSLALNLWRLLWRTLGRVRQRTALWNGNRETWRGAFLSRDSLFLHLLRTHYRRRRAYQAALDHPDYAHLQVARLRSPHEATAWLTTVSLRRMGANEKEEPR